MEFTAGGKINPMDLINLTKDLAQLNLGYLGIAVGILGVLGGVFIYFNIKPLKDSLNKQESAIDDLKKEASGLLSDSKVNTEEKLATFKVEQADEFLLALRQQRENIELETINKIQETERELTLAVELIAENKDTKLKELLLSEIKNGVSTLEKNLTETITTLKEEQIKKITDISNDMTSFKRSIKTIERDIKELKIYKFSKEGKMGAIIYSIELLKDDIDANRWSILRSLERLKEETKGFKLEAEYIADIEVQLARLKSDPKYQIIIEEIRKQYTEKKE